MFKIKNDDQRAKTLKGIRGFEEDLAKIRLVKGARAAAWFKKTYKAHVSELQEQVRRYDSLKRNGLPEIRRSDLSAIGSHLVDARIASGLTQGELARRLGVSQPMVFKYENAEYEGCGLAAIERALEALGLQLRLGLRRAPGTRRPVKGSPRRLSRAGRSSAPF